MNTNKIILSLTAFTVLSLSSLSFAATFYKDMLGIINNDKSESEKIKLIEGLTKKADVNATNNEINPIIYVVGENRNPKLTPSLKIKILNVLLPQSKIKTINYVDKSSGRTALSYACLYAIYDGGSIDIVKLLLKHGADVDGKTKTDVYSVYNKSTAKNDAIISELKALITLAEKQQSSKAESN